MCGYPLHCVPLAVPSLHPCPSLPIGDSTPRPVNILVPSGLVSHSPPGPILPWGQQELQLVCAKPSLGGARVPGTSPSMEQLAAHNVRVRLRGS